MANLKNLTALLAVALLALSFVVAQRIAAGAAEVAALEERHHRMHVLADELRQTSDDLTRMVRTFAATGDARYADYFREILAIRNGEAPRPAHSHGIYWDLVLAGEEAGETSEPVALRALMEREGFSDEELSLLQRSEDASNQLVGLETRAMNAMEGRFEDDSGAFTVTGEPDPELALALLHGEEYHAAKAAIMAPLRQLFETMEERIGEEAAAARARAGSAGRWLDVALILAFLSLVVSVFAGPRKA